MNTKKDTLNTGVIYLQNMMDRFNSNVPGFRFALRVKGITDSYGEGMSFLLFFSVRDLINDIEETTEIRIKDYYYIPKKERNFFIIDMLSNVVAKIATMKTQKNMKEALISKKE